jgi:ribosomal protein S18 acetylase RimI-like enzyme
MQNSRILLKNKELDYHISLADLADLPRIQDLNLMLFKREKELFDETVSLNWTKGLHGTRYFHKVITSDKGFAAVARLNHSNDDAIIGYIAGCILKWKNPTRTISGQAELENMYVVRQYRRKGIGTSLVKEFIKWVKSKKIKNIRMGVYAANQQAKGFYKSLGFKDRMSLMETNIEV